ncbi:MAG TPA: sigma-70 family RNA polymerase sigma factor [Isosphaeraceae bacterium]|nr:sigma-70 family RNA polymerase sigma factor [Isosphaeraceae bacterium]
MTEPEPDTFQNLIERVRAGDEGAATELVRRYEPMVRRVARVRLADRRLGRLLDSMDICQSVMASFFVRAALGQYELNTPDQLLRLLATMARNKLANHAHGQRAARRDVRRLDYGEAVAEGVAGRDGTPSRQVAARELLDVALARLTASERRLLERRQEGTKWAEIAMDEGDTPEALRKKLTRAVERVAREIGLDESGGG